jgi:hypothetical protein
MAALGLSLLLNALILAVVGFAALKSAVMRKLPPVYQSVPADPVATIFAEFSPPTAPAEPAQPAKQQFARTSDDQIAEPVEKPPFMGERNTRATSDRTPDATAPPLPSQAGIEPRHENDLETTESNYQDGSLTGSDRPAPVSEEIPSPATPAVPSPPEPAMPSDPTMAKPADTPGKDTERSVPPVREKLLEGPNPVDVQVPREAKPDENIKPTPEKRPAENSTPQPKVSELNRTVEAPKPKASQDPAFKGFQRKTAVTGSISRTGRSALDVEDSPLGRYQAVISRAVELEWQRNCVRHRDFITPGFLTVRFFVEPSGKVRSVQFVGDMETGEVQKGFTLNSIRDADIPAMPPAIRKDYNKEPLELLFRFYF